MKTSYQATNETNKVIRNGFIASVQAVDLAAIKPAAKTVKAYSFK